MIHGITKIALLLSTLTLIPVLSKADAGPGWVYFSGSLRPENETQVEMVEETVTFSNFVSCNPQKTAYDNQGASFDVRAEFKLRNTGEYDEKVGMFFPFCVDHYMDDNPQKSNCIASSTRVTLDGKTLAHKMRKEFNKKYGSPSLQITFEADFPAKQTRTLIVSYVIRESDGSNFADSLPPFAGFDYILHSGSGWKGKIGKGKVIVVMPYLVTEQNVEISRRQRVPNYDGAHKQIGKDFTLSRHDHRVEFTFDNLEPKKKHDFSVWVQNPSFLEEIKKLEDELKEKPGDKQLTLRLLRKYHLLFNTKSLVVETFRPLVVSRYPKAKEKRISRLANAYWNYLFYDSDVFIENRVGEWPSKVCNSVDEIFYIVATSRKEKERLCNEISYGCGNSDKYLPRICHEFEL